MSAHACHVRRRVLAEVGHATEHHERILSSAVDKADGLGDADLKRLKYVVTNLKGGVLELSAHARFVDGTRSATLEPSLRVSHALLLTRKPRSREREPEPRGGLRAVRRRPGAPLPPLRRCRRAPHAYETLPDS